jgi:ABC-type nickel/cobalt efflux system permease component RcnA
MRRPSRPRRVARALLLALGVLSIGPAAAFAHPLGNFTINHFAGIRISSDRIDLDVVIDRAEIPTFQERQRLDTNGDGTVAPAEIEAERQVACQALASDLWLTVGGRRAALAVAEAGLSFPPGAGGLSTMRLVCEYTAGVATGASTGTAVAFEDRSFAERIGWREIVMLGDRVTLSGPFAAIDPEGVSKRLTVYPTDLLTQPLDERSASVTAASGGPALPGWTAPDAAALANAGAIGTAGSSGSGVGAVPGGVAPELAAIIDAGGLEPGVLLASLLVALVLGAAHAVSPGHGKTIMAAYLVGTRGTARHAIGLGLTVTVSHTLGVLALAGVTLLAADVLPPDRLYPILQVASGALVIAIGGRLLVSRLRAVLAQRASAPEHQHHHDTALGQDPGAPRPHVHSHGGRAHSHGGRAHSHAPADGASLSWRSLFALGLSGGLVPSASALILLLGSIAAGHVAYGVVLVLAFGIGMALVLGGVGLALVRASRLVERLPRRWSLGRLAGAVQLATAGLVVILGLVLTSQALTTVL